jgi:uncharacterized protein with HEPN domain
MASAIDKIRRFTAGKSFGDFASDPMLHDAVVRNLEIISEASRHLGDDMKQQEPAIPWRSVADIGNWLRHGYDIVNDDVLWEAIARDLPPLMEAIGRLMHRGADK